MRRRGIAAAAAAALALAGCSPATIQKIDAVVSAVLPLEQCVVSKVLGGMKDPLTIGAACGGLLPGTVIAIVSALDAAKSADASGDAATLHAFVLANPPTAPGTLPAAGHP